VRTDVLGMTATTVRNVAPHVDIAPKHVSLAGTLPAPIFADLALGNDHAPPNDVGASSLILRI
jgi:hypothetical protein